MGPYQEYGSDKQILTLIKRVKGLDGQLLGLLMVDMSFNAIQQALQRAMGRNQAAIYISSRGDELVVGCNMALYQPPVTTAGVVGSELEVIWHGRHLRRELEGSTGISTSICRPSCFTTASRRPC